MRKISGIISIANIYLAPSIRFLVRGGLNSVMGYARLCPRAYNLALRLRPRTEKRIERAK